MRLRSLALAAAVCTVATGALTVTLSPASAATTGCSVVYKVTGSWQGGFQGDIAITNLGDALSSWSLGFDFPTTTQKVSQGWGGTFGQSGQHVTVTNASWNGSLATNASASVGFIGSWSGSNPVPASFTVNGVTCTG